MPIAAAVPDLPRGAVEWRFDCLLGDLAYTMANNGRIRALTQRNREPGGHERALRRLVPFLAAGVRSPAT